MYVKRLSVNNGKRGCMCYLRYCIAIIESQEGAGATQLVIFYKPRIINRRGAGGGCCAVICDTNNIVYHKSAI
jgi:hypothetical protein